MTRKNHHSFICPNAYSCAPSRTYMEAALHIREGQGGNGWGKIIA